MSLRTFLNTELNLLEEKLVAGAFLKGVPPEASSYDAFILRRLLLADSKLRELPNNWAKEICLAVFTDNTFCQADNNAE